MIPAPVSLREREKQCMGCLLEDDDGTMRLENLFDLLRVFLGDTLFEHLWQRLDKLFRLDTTSAQQRKRFSKIKIKIQG